MAKYVGKRVVPLPCGEWDQRKEYEMLSVVLHKETGDSYIARRQVPAGTAITDSSFWTKSSDYSQQLQNVSDQLTETLKAVKADNDATEAAIRQDNDATEQIIKSDNTATKSYVDEVTAAALADMTAAKTTFDVTSAALTTRMNNIVGQNTSDTEVLDARVDYHGTSYENLGNAVRGGDEALQAEIEAVRYDLSYIDGSVRMPEFELGVVTVSEAGIKYSNSTTRIRMKQGTFLSLKAGDKVHNADKSVLYFLGGYRNSAGEYVGFNTRNGDYTMPEDGDLYLCARNADTTVIEDVDALASLIHIIRATSMKSDVQTLSKRADGIDTRLSAQDVLNEFDDQRIADIDGVIRMPAFELGVVEKKDDAVNYYNSVARIRTVRALHLKEGDRIHSNDWSKIFYFPVYVNESGEVKATVTRNSDFVMPEDADVYITARKPDSSAIEDVDALAANLMVIRPVSLKNDIAEIETRIGQWDAVRTEQEKTNADVAERLANLDGMIRLPAFEIGVLDLKEDVITYSNSTTRARMPEGTFLSLKAGDTIHSDDWSVICILGLYINGEGTKVGIKTRASDYVMPEDGDLYLCARKYDATVIEDVDELISHLSVIRPENLSNLGTRLDADEEIMEQHTERIDRLESDELKANELYFNGRIFRRAYNPYKPGGSKILTGQLHCHISHKNEDGEIVYYGGNDMTTMQHYKDVGYDFLTMTNYGHMGVIYHPEEGSMPEGLTWLCDGQEAAINGTGNPNQSEFPCKHSCVWNTTEAYPWMPKMEWQEWADMTKKKGEIVTIAHPAWSSTYQAPSVLSKVKRGIRFCEIYNGACDSASKAGSRTSSGFPIYTLPEGKDIDFAWETLLDNGCITWGIGVSDAHSNNNLAVLANGCVKVFADHNERFEIMKNLCNGNFYACSNVSATINRVAFSDGTLTIDNGDEGASTVFLKEGGEELATVTGATASYTMDGTEKYVRAVITLSSGERVWTQPIINLFSKDYDNYFDFSDI